MIKFYETVTNTRGDSLPNYRVQVVDSAGATVTIYEDSSGTRFTDSSGNIINYATADSRTGKVEFYWTPATGQVLQVLDLNGELVDATADFADKYVLANLPGEIAQSAVTNLTTDIAALHGLSGSFLLPYEYSVAGDYSFTADTGTDDTAALQAMADAVDTDAIPGMDLFKNGADYLVTSPIILEKAGGGIIGTKLPSYTRGQKKGGNFVIDSAADYGIHLPYDGLWTDPDNQADADYVFADCWTFKNIGFRQRTGATAKTKIGIWYDMQNNGPHRHMLLDQVSGSGLRSVFEVAPVRSGVTTCLANLIVQNSVLSNNRYGVYASGPVYCLRFVGNQAEQNNNGSGADQYDGGAIHGNFAGAITVTDNMLEGQPNAINIEASAARINALVARNYLETNNVNSSQFVGRFKTNQTFLNNTLTWGPNFFSGSNFPTDFLVIEGKGNWVLNMNDPYPVVFKNLAGSILRGSNIFPRGVQSFGIKGIDTVTKQPEIYLGDGFSRLDTGSSWTHKTFTSTNELDSPFGKVFGHDGTDDLTLGISCTAGDLLVVTVLVSVQDVVMPDPNVDRFVAQLTNGSGTSSTSLGNSYAHTISGGDWVVISYPIIASSTLATPGFQYAFSGAATGKVRIAGMCARNYGAYTNDGTVRQDITPVMPRVQLAGPRILAQSAIPLIIPSSGTMGNNGALSGIAAVSAVHPNAFVYLPANAIEAGSAAGFYYAVFSSTTAATVYNNTYTPGTSPAVPSSPTAFSTTGPGAYTAPTTAIEMAKVTVPGNAMGPSGGFKAGEQLAYTNSANTKTLTLKFGGTTFRNTAPTTTASMERLTFIRNRGSASVQVGPPSGQALINQATTVSPITGANNTTTDQDIVFQAQLANAADTVALEGHEVILWPKG